MACQCRVYEKQLGKQMQILRGYAAVVRGSLLFLGPNLGPRKRYAGEFSFHIRVMFGCRMLGKNLAAFMKGSRISSHILVIVRAFVA